MIKRLKCNNTLIIKVPTEIDGKQNNKPTNEKFQWRKQRLTTFKIKSKIKKNGFQKHKNES